MSISYKEPGFMICKNDTISNFYVLCKNVKNPLKSMISEGEYLKYREQAM